MERDRKRSEIRYPGGSEECRGEGGDPPRLLPVGAGDLGSRASGFYFVQIVFVLPS